MGIALIEARGAFDLAQKEFQNTEELANRKAVSENEVNRAEISMQTAKVKVRFITSFAEKILEQTNQDLKANESRLEEKKKLTERGLAAKSSTSQDETDRRTLLTKKQMLESMIGKGDKEAAEGATPGTTNASPR